MAPILQSAEHQIISLTGQSELNPLGDYNVAGDLSSAAFFIAAALVTAQARLSLRSIGYNKSRTGFIDTLKEMGATISVSGERLKHGEPVADLLIESSKLQGDFDLRGDMIANLIDEIPVLAVVATQLNGTLNIRGARELRVKESDRIRSVSTISAHWEPRSRSSTMASESRDHRSSAAEGSTRMATTA